MILLKEHTAYNGLRCDFHKVCDFIFDVTTGECDAIVGSYETLAHALRGNNPVESVRIQCHGVAQGDGMAEQINQQVLLDPRFSDAVVAP